MPCRFRLEVTHPCPLAVPEKIFASLPRLCLISFDRCAFLALLHLPPEAQGSSTPKPPFPLPRIKDPRGRGGGLRGSNKIKETPHNDIKIHLLRYFSFFSLNAYDTTFYPLMQYRTSPYLPFIQYYRIIIICQYLISIYILKSIVYLC